jgi:hypothetical protein
MSTEHDDRDVEETFRYAYEQLVDRAPVSDPEWPPVLTAQATPSPPAPRGWRVAAIAFLITLAFGLGGLIAPGQPAAGPDPFQVQTGTTITALPDRTGTPYPTPADAAIAYAEAQEPDIEDPQVTRMFVIYAGQDLVDLRVQVESDDFCHWYGVIGQVEQDELVWRGGPAQPCDGS